jgi:hypothetical protein
MCVPRAGVRLNVCRLTKPVKPSLASGRNCSNGAPEVRFKASSSSHQGPAAIPARRGGAFVCAGRPPSTGPCRIIGALTGASNWPARNVRLSVASCEPVHRLSLDWRVGMPRMVPVVPLKHPASIHGSADPTRRSRFCRRPFCRGLTFGEI